jgi:2-polyprenyl-6-methoxyphenol hydroxylase-like FAD-dependent oxidoreductase
MTPSTAAELGVLVVGAGPVGLALACELYRHGLPCRIIDKSTGPTTQSRALAIQPRTLEVLDQIGIIDELSARAVPVHGLTVSSEHKRLAHLRFDFSGLETHYPLVLALPQGETEQLLAARLEGLGGRVERQTSLEEFQHDISGVKATIRDEHGSPHEIRARWLVGCDGARSMVRRGLGVGFEGFEYEEAFLLADVRIAWDRATDEGHLLTTPEGLIAAFPLPGERWRLIDIGTSPGTDDPVIVAAYFQDRLRANGVPDAVVSDPAWASVFRVHRRLADDFRIGRCFLAGDAAHIHSPAGGQGMNTGIQDAFNLAWKLALVDAGQASESLLDSYTPERRPVAEGVERGTDMLTRLWTLREPISRAVRDRVVSVLGDFDFVRTLATRGASELAVSYRHSPIVAEDRPRLASLLPGPAHDFARGPHPGDRVPDVSLDPAGNGSPRRLFEVLRGNGHHLLLFNGSIEHADDAIGKVLELVQAEFARWITPHRISIAAVDATIHDPGGVLHGRFGARAACLYLIRPDNYIGYRSMPPDASRLREYLHRIFVS